MFDDLVLCVCVHVLEEIMSETSHHPPSCDPNMQIDGDYAYCLSLEEEEQKKDLALARRLQVMQQIIKLLNGYFTPNVMK